MDEEYQVHRWIKSNTYAFFKQCAQRGSYPTSQEAEHIAPLLLMYQAIKIGELTDAIDSLWHLFEGGHAEVQVDNSSREFEVSVSLPQEEEKKTRK